MNIKKIVFFVSALILLGLSCGCSTRSHQGPRIYGTPPTASRFEGDSIDLRPANYDFFGGTVTVSGDIAHFMNMTSYYITVTTGSNRKIAYLTPNGVTQVDLAKCSGDREAIMYLYVEVVEGDNYPIGMMGFPRSGATINRNQYRVEIRGSPEKGFRAARRSGSW